MKLITTIILLATITFSQEKQSEFKLLGKELKRDLSVLFISQEPSEENLELISYFRFELGASITNAYVTNGEGAYDKNIDILPNDVAVKRREEAENINKLLKSDYFFMNMVYNVPANEKEIEKEWSKDVLENNIKAALTASQPDVIILIKDKNYLQKNIRYKYFTTSVINLLKKRDVIKEFGNIKIYEEGDNGIEINRNLFGDELNESYKSYGDYLKMFYRSQSLKIVANDSSKIYLKPLYKNPTKKEKWESSTSIELTAIKNSVKKVGELFENKNYRKTEILEKLAIAISEVDFKLRDKKIISNKRNLSKLFNWKKALEKARVKLLDIKLHYRLSESVLTPSQITYMDVDSTTLPKELKGTTEIYFPLQAKGWIINESMINHFPLENIRYRLISPSEFQTYIPYYRYYSNQRTISFPFKFIVIHKDENPLYNFMFEDNLEIYPANRFIVEPKWPIVRLQKAERIPIQLANNSRDPVYDELNVNDTIATGRAIKFRLMTKGTTQNDTLLIDSVMNAKDGDYLLNIAIQGDVVSRAAARKFEVKIDTPKSVFVRTQQKTEPISVTALKRIGVTAKYVSIIQNINLVDIIFIDRNDLTKSILKQDELKNLEIFLQSGGKLVILSQESNSWNNSELKKLVNVNLNRENTEQSIIEEGELLSNLNNIKTGLLNNWLYQKVDNKIELNEDLKIFVGNQKNPGIVGKKWSNGTIIYINLNLNHQFMNIQPESYKLLGNIISYKEK